MGRRCKTDKGDEYRELYNPQLHLDLSSSSGILPLKQLHVGTVPHLELIAPVAFAALTSSGSIYV